ncbi:MAG: SGNH/GDSL hydrolase family protein [Anaerolineales bacterium]|nr:SGNH/GDSL hydrolase family protein [Anaerolineales bacterium]
MTERTGARMDPVRLPQGSRGRKTSPAILGGSFRRIRAWCWRAASLVHRSFPRRPAVHAVGDSHAKFIFRGAPDIRLHHLGPVTMHRIARDGRAALLLSDLGVHDRDIVIWCLGEIDVRCHLVPQARRQGVTVASLAASLAGGFLRSVSEIQKDARALRTVILSVIPPTDQAPNPAFPIAGTLAERVEARRILNRSLAEQCSAFDFHFLDPFDPFADPEGALRRSMSDGNVHVGPSHADRVLEPVRDLCSPWRETLPSRAGPGRDSA